MTVVHVHLLLNHVPVVGALIGVALLTYALARRSSEVGKVSLALFASLAALSVGVFLTGEPAEEIVENLPGFSERITHRHEDFARLAMMAILALGAFGLGALTYFRRRPLPRWVLAGSLVMSLGVCALMAVTANLGGQIRHSEIRSGMDSGMGAEEEDR